jgi:type IV pilus assembly protein PilM
MIGPWKRSNRTPIGIDVGAHSIKAIQLARAGSGWRVAAATSLPREDPTTEFGAADAQRLSDVLDRQGFAGRRAVLGVPRGKLVAGLHEVPKDAADIAAGVRAEMARVSKREADRLEVGHWELPAAARGAGSRVMAVACPHDAADPLLDAFESHGVIADALDAQPLALARACAPLTPPDAVSAIVDIGWTATLLILSHRGAITYERSIREVRLASLHEGIQQKLGVPADVVDYLLTHLNGDAARDIDPDLITDAKKVIEVHFEPMAHEVRASLSYAEHQYPEAPVGKLTLTGGGAAVTGLTELMTQAVGIEAARFDPAARVDAGALADRVGPATAVAIGLALHGEAE